MTPTRRDFLKILLGSAAAATFDFEKLLWVRKPMIVVPPRDLWLPRDDSGIFRAIMDGGKFNIHGGDFLDYNEKLNLYRHYGMLFEKIGDPINGRDQRFDLVNYKLTSTA